jgi:large subunit ribosomal protein L17
MRHHNSNRIFGRPRKGRIALLRSLARSLILHGKMETTLAKAREIRPFVEKLITKSKENTLTVRRTLTSALGTIDTDAVDVLVNELGPRFKERAGGYTRIIKTGTRLSDASPKASIEFV